LVPALLLIQTFAAAQQQVVSPDGKLQAAFTLRNGNFFYQLSWQGKPVVVESRLDLELAYFGKEVLKPDSLWQGLKWVKTETRAADTLWQPLYGERSQIRDHYRELVMTFRNAGKKDTISYFQVIARAYNEGLAFRYSFPEQLSVQTLEISREKTHFTFPTGSYAWFTGYAQDKYQRLPLRNWAEPTERPLTVELPGGLFACVAEAQMVNYARMKMRLKGPDTLVSDLASQVTETPPFATPWRVVMVAEKPGQLLENNHLILNLNLPNALKETDWIRPGKVIRVMHLSTGAAREYVDFAVQQGLQYVHFDAGWYGHEYEIAANATEVDVDPRRNPAKDLDLQQAIRYARSKGIGVFLYVNHRALERQLDSILPLYKSWGVAGIKFGFVHSGSHRWSTWLHEAVKKCAQHQLMVNIHDEYRPTGFSRTYPNLMTQEGVRGNEEMPDATQNCVLPFTRYVAGAADYTVGYFFRKEFGNEKRHILNTPAHQLALPVIYYSPLQWLYWYDKPADYQGEPELEFWKHLPTVWDQTLVLQGTIGQYVSVARRKGEEWFAGFITNTEARQLPLSFGFLPKGKKYLAYIYEDGGGAVATRTHVAVRTGIVDTNSRLTVNLQPSGGQAMRIVPATNADLKKYRKL
jgi:alpha-glucosidase